MFDIGCGTGELTSLVASHVKPIVGFDSSESAIELTRARNSAANIEYRVAGLATLAIDGLAATRVFAVGSLHHLDSYAHGTRVARTSPRVRD
jgi:2-polyprenyl-3-methyl-5-hydroxy-6-metoxy-1,4-benzoquinol methylase